MTENTDTPLGSAVKRSRTEFEDGDSKMEPASNGLRDISEGMPNVW